jgi:TonB-linked SusC/RagA family outer membrane protein
LEYDFSGLTDLLKGLTIAAFASYNYGQTTDSNYSRYYELYTVNRTFDESVQGATGYTVGKSYWKASSWGDNWMFRPQISYSREFLSKHAVNMTFLLEKRKVFNSTMQGSKRGYVSDDPVDLKLGTEFPPDPVTGSYSYFGQKSYVGRFNYAYNNKYLAEFLFRTDWSVKFASDNRKGFFPSGSIGWVVSQEDFFADALPMVDFLKVRASYGQAGKDNVQKDFIYNSSYDVAQNSMALGGKSIAQFYSTNPYIIRNLKWSTTHSYNVGLDLNMWKGKLGVELDVFYQITADILERVDSNYPPSIAGFFPNTENSGKMENKGFELSLKHNNRINSDWSYGLRGNFSFARNKVLHRAMTDNHPNYQPEVGTSLGVRYGFKALGLFQSWEEIDQYPKAPTGFLRPGDIKYLDYDGNGEIDTGKLSGDAPPNKDYVRIGYGAVPEISFNFTMDVSYKNFYLTMLWQGVTHTDWELSGWWDDRQYPAATPYTSWGGGNAPKYLIEDAWTPENPNARYPRLSTLSNGNNAWQSSWWIIDGTYLRLKNMNIGYTVPANVLQKTPFSRINIYVAGTNMLTFSHFQYLDPESPSVSIGYYPQQKTYSIGANITF